MIVKSFTINYKTCKDNKIEKTNINEIEIKSI